MIKKIDPSVQRRKEALEDVLKKVSSLNKNILKLNPEFDKILSEIDDLQRFVRHHRDNDLSFLFSSAKFHDVVRVLLIAKGGISRVSSKCRKIESERDDLFESFSKPGPTFY